MDYILSCLQDLVENGAKIKPGSNLVNDPGLESIRAMDLLVMLEDRFDTPTPINIPLDVKIFTQLMEILLPRPENKQWDYMINTRVLLASVYNSVTVD